MAPLTWGREVEQALIQLVKEQPALWRPSHPHYPKKTLKRDLYNKIAAKLQPSFPHLHPHLTAENVQAKYTNLRTSFNRELKRITTGSKSKESQWLHFQSMLFLKDVVELSPGSTTFSVEPSCDFESTCSFEPEVESCDVDGLPVEKTVYKEEQHASSAADTTRSSPGNSSIPDVVKISIGKEQHTPQTPTSPSARPSSIAAGTPPTSRSLTESSMAQQPPTKRSKVSVTQADAEPLTQNILNYMASALSDVNAPQNIGHSCATLVQRTCEKLPYINQIRLLQKLAVLMEEELTAAGLAE